MSLDRLAGAMVIPLRSRACLPTITRLQFGCVLAWLRALDVIRPQMRSYGMLSIQYREGMTLVFIHALLFFPSEPHPEFPRMPALIWVREHMAGFNENCAVLPSTVLKRLYPGPQEFGHGRWQRARATLSSGDTGPPDQVQRMSSCASSRPSTYVLNELIRFGRQNLVNIPNSISWKCKCVWYAVSR